MTTETSPEFTGKDNLADGTANEKRSLGEYIDTSKIGVLNADAKTCITSLFPVVPSDEKKADTKTEEHKPTTPVFQMPMLKSDADVDAQLLITIPFKETVTLHAVSINAATLTTEEVKGASPPRRIKLFVNQPDFGFENCEQTPATQDLVLTFEQTWGGVPIPLKLAKFLRVHTLTLFIASNQGDTPVTYLTGLDFIGTVVAGMHVEKIKKPSRLY